MDSFTFNKIAGAVLASLLLMVGLRTGIQIFYPKGTADVSKGSLHIVDIAAPAAAPTPGAAQGDTQDPPVATLLAGASPTAGEAAMKACGTCHIWVKGGGNKVGPNLWGVVGREIAKEPGFSYSSALAGHGGKWTFDNLYEWLKNPKAFVPGNKMAYAGVKDAKDRANIIAYLDKQSDNPVPLAQK
jgi:cytochrome c